MRVRKDQILEVQPISATTLPLPTLAATSTAQTDGSQKAIVRGGAKGATTAADVTSTSQSADRNALDVQIRTSAGAVVDTFGGGTQFAEDAAHVDGGVGTLSLAVRNDAQVSRTSANADYSSIAVDDVGRPIVASAAYSTRIDEASATVTYIGNALCGSVTSAAVWQIKKIDSASGTSITFADGDPQFNNIWDNRAALTYS